MRRQRLTKVLCVQYDRSSALASLCNVDIIALVHTSMDGCKLLGYTHLRGVKVFASVLDSFFKISPGHHHIEQWISK